MDSFDGCRSPAYGKIKMPKNVIDAVVNPGFCIGCGTCAGICPTHNLRMEFDSYGELKPLEVEKCSKNCKVGLDCCPRSKDTISEDTIGKQNFADIPGIDHSAETGYFLKCYEGYSDVGGHRENGASGGLATWFLEQLLKRGKVTGVACVRSKQNPEQLFEFFIAKTIGELRSAASSAYYPVEMSAVIRTILNEKGRYAVVGVPCFLTALSLAERRFPRLGRRISYKVGLVCSRLPSKNYVKFFADHFKVSVSHIDKIRFRDKSVYPSRKRGMMLQTREGRIYRANHHIDFIWGSGKVTPTACMFCDDVFAETADVTFMDAWMPEYQQEHYGVSLVLARRPDVVSIFEKGQAEKFINIKSVDIDRLIQAQKGRILNKREQLQYRILLAKKWGIPYPPQKRQHNSSELRMLGKAKTIATFYRQQVSHGKSIPVKNRILPAFVTFCDNMWTLARKIRARLKYGKVYRVENKD